MANFQNNAITDAGRNLLSHVQMGAVFEPTRIVLGSGYLPAGTTTRTITAVVTPVKTLTINKKKRANDGTVTIGGVYSNQDVSTSFYFRELGLYAKATYEDGTEVPEVLYSYGNAGDAAELMPAYSSGRPVERQMDIVTYIGNDTAVNLTIDSGVYVTQGELNEAIQSVGGGGFLPLTIPKEGWQSGAYGRYTVYFDVAAEVSAEDSAEVILSVDGVEAAGACGMCPAVETISNALRFRAISAPEAIISGEYRIIYDTKGV